MKFIQSYGLMFNDFSFRDVEQGETAETFGVEYLDEETNVKKRLVMTNIIGRLKARDYRLVFEAQYFSSKKNVWVTDQFQVLFPDLDETWFHAGADGFALIANDHYNLMYVDPTQKPPLYMDDEQAFEEINGSELFQEIDGDQVPYNPPQYEQIKQLKPDLIKETDFLLKNLLPSFAQEFELRWRSLIA